MGKSESDWCFGIPLREAKGRTIKNYAWSWSNGQMVITFTDGAFTTLGIDRGYESGDETIQPAHLEVFDFGDRELITVGLVTQEELGKRRFERDAKRDMDREEQERETYERLKGKYGEEEV